MSTKKKSPIKRPAKPVLKGMALLHDPRWNKGTAFTEAERDSLGLRGLLPPRVFTEDDQLRRVLDNFHRKSSALEQYIFLIALQDRNETLFYRAVTAHLTEMMPIIYTPTVGEACKQFGHIFRRPRGLYVSCEDRGRVGEVLRNWPQEDVAVIVVTDGERILGLGDLGAYGMGIPIGKLSLYTACAGIHPASCLPIMLDVGTDNRELLDDPLYTGVVRRRLRGEAYDAFIEEFLTAVTEAFPGAVVQFEDFATRNALELLRRYRERLCTFNDDIQGTAAVTLAGLLSAGRITGGRLTDQRLLFFGAGAAATGIADLIVSAMVREGLEERDARARCWFFDSKGLVVSAREQLAPHKRRYAHEGRHVTELVDAVRSVEPTALIGVSGQPGTFTEPVLEAMAELNARPIVFALSNPTNRAECTAEEAYRWTEGRAVFASGSPFDPVMYDGRRFVPGQGNNAYIFPGLGLGVVASGATRVTDDMFYAAARALAEEVGEASLERGTIFPPLAEIRRVSCRIAAAVARVAAGAGLTTRPLPDDLVDYMRSRMYEPVYRRYA